MRRDGGDIAAAEPDIKSVETSRGSSQNFVRPIISSRMIAALLTKMSSRPCSLRIWSNSAFT